VLGPDGLKSPQASWRLNVAHYANSDHWRRLDDGNRLDDFLLVELRSLSGDLSHDVRHTGLVADETGQVTRLSLVILGVGLEAAEMAAASLSGQKALGTVSGCFEFSMRHYL